MILIVHCSLRGVAAVASSRLCHLDQDIVSVAVFLGLPVWLLVFKHPDGGGWWNVADYHACIVRQLYSLV
jgi:hypothetical protein